MTHIANELARPGFQALGWALVHFLWQGALVALGLASAKLWLRQSTARVRYAVSCIFLLILLALPVATLATLVSQPQPVSDSGWTEAQSGATTTVWAATVAASGSALGGGIIESVTRFLPAIVAVWILGVVLLSLRWMAAWACLRRVRSAASLAIPPAWNEALREMQRRLAVSTPVRLSINRLAQGPSVAGWLRPVILLPAAALAGLDRPTLEAVLAHELAHIRRHDYLVNLAQVAVETLLFYHPAVWWVSREIRLERENCCDDAAAGVCGDRVIYARALVELEQARAEQGPAEPSFALAATGGSLLRRVERLLRGAETAGGHSPSWFSALAGVVIVACAVASLHPEARAQVLFEPPFALRADEPSPVPSARPVARPRARLMAAAVLPSPAAPTRSPQTQANPAPESQAAPESSRQEDFLTGMAEAGFRNLPVDQLIALKVHGVTPEFARSVKQAGYASVTPEQLINLRIHGVDAGFMQEVKGEGLGDLSLEALVDLRIHGVTPDFIGQMKNAGYAGLKAGQLTNLRIHGVDGAFAEAVKSAGLGRLSLDDLVSLRIHGVTPDFIAGMRDAGYGNLTAEKLTELRIHGVDGAYARGLKSNGLANLSPDDLIGLRIHGVDPAFVGEMKDAGYGGLTAEEYQRLRTNGVDAGFVQHLSQHGFKNLTVEQLIHARRAGM